MWSVLLMYLEDVGALEGLREREGRIRRGVLERDMLMGMALWAMMDLFFWMVWCGEGCRGCNFFISMEAIIVSNRGMKPLYCFTVGAAWDIFFKLC